MHRTLLFTALTGLFTASAQAEIFRCEQADGTTVFAHVPCRVERPTPSSKTSSRGVIEDVGSDVIIDGFVDVAAAPRTVNDIEKIIKEIENALEELRDARAADIANAPFSAADPTTLAQLKRDIRAEYQTEIDERLTELLALRQRKSQLIADSSNSTNAD